MKTFDVSVNVLNTNVVWKQRTTPESSHTSLYPNAPKSNQPPHQPLQQPLQQPLHQPQCPQSNPQQFNQQGIATGTEVVCNWRRPHLKSEMIFLTLPFFVLLSLVVTFQQNANVHILSTLIGSILVLTTPAVFVVWQSKPWRVEKQNYVHMFFLHGAGVLAILQTSYVSVVFIVFSVVFAHLIQQNITKIINSRKNIRNTGMCTMMLILNGIALILLRQETAESSWHIHILCSVVALLSISVYIVYTYIESYA
jgi:hypothetical protein